MKGKLLFVAGAAVGYVLGARAGRKRYEQIRAGASKVWETPGIQRQVHTAQDLVAKKIGDVPGALIEGAKRAVSTVANRPAQTRQKAESATEDASSNASTTDAAGTAAEKPPAKKATSTASKSASKKKPATKKPASSSGS